ncbi:polysaccharide deacetylase family protein [Pseudogracilibacillus sp. SO30301A]|uniref:polysaccharide deacetylase family protein n=1 Tax=Pseudogracilibacillus sp. SO30301A TaxID=3098291 RepID=UPI00300E654D
MRFKESSRFHLILFCSLFILLSACGATSNESTSNDGTKKNETASDSTEVEKDIDEEENDVDTDVDEKKDTEAKEAVYKVTPEWFVTPTNDANEKVVLLTIDDAPDKHAVEMAKTLKGLDAPAIFFVNGHFLQDEEGRKQLQEINELGFPIGNHTMTHTDLTTISEEEQKEEISEVNRLVEEIIGEKPKFFRAPFGKNTDYSKKLAEEEGMLLMNWMYGYDWDKEYQEADALTDIMVDSPLLGEGAILLMHDRDWTNDALSDIVTGLQDKGYEMLDPLLIENVNE